MPSPKLDRRTERTRQALLGAFVDALLRDGYEAVSVGMVTAKANIGRSTFYMHFRGKEDLLRQAFAHPSSGLASVVDGDIQPAALAPLLDHFRAQKRLNGVLLEAPVRRIWITCLADLILPRLQKRTRHAAAPALLPLNLIAHQLAEAQIALVANWLMGRRAQNAETMAAALIAMTAGMLTAWMPLRPPQA